MQIQLLKEIKYIFTKEFKNDIAFEEFKYKIKDKARLKSDNSESVDEKIARLKKLEQNGKIKVLQKNYSINFE